MVSLRCLGLCLVGLAFASSPWPLQAAATTVLNPPAGAGSPGATATTPPVVPTPPVPGNPPAPAGTLPGVIAPAQPAAVAPSAGHLGASARHAGGGRLRSRKIGRPKFFTSYQDPNWSAPWIFDIPRRASGTGFLIDGQPHHDQRACRRVDDSARRPALP